VVVCAPRKSRVTYQEIALKFELTTAFAVLALAACSGGDKPAEAGKSGAASTSGAAKPAEAAKPAAPAGPNMVDLPKLGLKAEVPAGTEVKDAIIGEGQMLQGPDLVASIEVASDTRPKDLAAAKSDAEMYTPKNPKEETLPDGFAYSFENTGGMGTNYWVMVRRTIGGKSYWCETTATSAAQQENALKACKSLK
jgi:hypothetical protein